MPIRTISPAILPDAFRRPEKEERRTVRTMPEGIPHSLDDGALKPDNQWRLWVDPEAEVIEADALPVPGTDGDMNGPAETTIRRTGVGLIVRLGKGDRGIFEPQPVRQSFHGSGLVPIDALEVNADIPPHQVNAEDPGPGGE